MRLELELRLEALRQPDAATRPLVEALIRECRAADGYDPRLRFDTHLNADKALSPWLLAWAYPPGEAPSLERQGGLVADIGPNVGPGGLADSEAPGPRLLVGAASAFAPGRAEGEIRACVAPAFRRQGVFRLLYSELEARLRGSGAESVLLVCEEASPSGAAVARRLGARLDHREILMRLREGRLAEASDDGRVRLVPVTGELLETEAVVSSLVFDACLDDERAFCEAMLADPEREAFLAMAAEGAIGMLALAGQGDAMAGRGTARTTSSVREGASAVINGLGVLPAYRRLGYGRDILSACLVVLRRRGVKDVFLEVDAGNEAALALYRQAGFIELSMAAYWRLARP